MEVRKLEKFEYVKYEKFLLEFNESLFYYSTKYKDFLEELLNVKSNYILAIDNNENIQAVLPLMVKEGKYGKIINSLPYFGSNGGILFKTNQSYNLLLKKYFNLLSECAGGTYICNPLSKSNQKPDYDILDKRIGQWTLLESKNDILNSYKSSARRNIKKATKENLIVEIDNNQKDFLYETHNENITAIGGRAKNKKFFDNLEKYFIKNKDYNIYIAKVNGKKIGALLLFYFNKTVEYFTPAIVREYRNLQALPLIIYKAMLHSIEKGYKLWNWGGTWLTQDSVYKFKNKFGAVDKIYNYFIKINNQSIYNSTKKEISEEYRDFYVIPFDKLKNNE